MQQQDIRTDIYRLLNLFEDYITHGFKKEHEIPDFSIPEPEQKVEVEFNIVEEDDTPGMIKEKRESIIKYAKNIINCTECPLHKISQKVTGAGNVSSKIAIITLPPTPDEEKNSKPLTGESLDYFIKWINAIGLDLQSLFITNIIKCSPKKQKIQKEFIQKCTCHLDNQLKIINPQAILSLGQMTISSLNRSFSDLMDIHGKIFYYNRIPVVPTFHPYHVLKNIDLKVHVWQDLKKFQNLLKKLKIIDE